MKYKLDYLTVGIPAYKSERYIIELLENIYSYEFIPSEIIICDDYPGSNISESINNFQKKYKEISLRYYRNENNLGIAGNYNKIVSLASNDWLHICDADDYPLPCFYKFMNETIQKTSYEVVVGNMITNNKVVNFIKTIVDFFFYFKTIPKWMPFLGSLTTRSSIIYKKDLLVKFPFPDPQFDGSDIIHTHEIQAVTRIQYCKKAKLFYRIHHNSSTSLQNEYSLYLDYIKKNHMFFYLIDFTLRKKIFSFLRNKK